jgi:phage tail sheath protein FI
VFKAPANEIVRGALDLEQEINDQVQDDLNPKGVNVIRSFPGRGIRVWGARTITSNALWKYVSVRRLFIFLERSIYEGTQWVVFEPNDDRLWARVTDTIRLFLRSQWRLGALFGRTEQEAFFITCDRTTMTQDDILNGRLICEIGIAPVRPAEFVIFRIFQNTAESQR